ncbi:hypothetical protein LOTGIDRAFT_165395 [Lottia gigantea]|uniref:Uncharacterized protein n=1 Tax=Lottia gigantea TaxID=225164 RepID=V4A5R0_LOTGI|nr:hypothetical protein LOTGIDRAFT_165395 [Lottia gigantea]ESO88611.1 hypothetical protein LOTGIDRAFT_165395 [Lottia gigantea]
MLKTVLYPKNYDSVSGWIPDVGDGSVLKEPVRNVPNDADEARMRSIARNTIERVGRVLQYNMSLRIIVAMNQTQDPIIRKNQVRLNNDNYPNQLLTINPTTKDYNELYRNYKNMCELFGNSPQFEYVDFAINHPIFCFDLSAYQEDLFKTGVNINIHIEKTQDIKKLINRYKHCKVRDDIDLERIDAKTKEGGFLPFLPLIFAGLAAAEATAGGAAGINTSHQRQESS